MSTELINWLRDGRYRLKILNLLVSRPMLPSEIAKALDISRSSVSRILKGLRDRGLVKTIHGRTRTITYVATDSALKVLDVWERYYADRKQ
jgi:DNA-binding transcriptional regulator GbsR (MarR family)